MAVQLAFVEDWYWEKVHLPELNWSQQQEQQGEIPVLALPSGPADEIETCGLFFLHAINSAQRRLWIVGTANLDNRSFRVNFEMTLVFADVGFAAEVAGMLEQDFAQCDEICYTDVSSLDTRSATPMPESGRISLQRPLRPRTSKSMTTTLPTWPSETITSGFGFPAYPTEYAQSGIMTLIINERGSCSRRT